MRRRGVGDSMGEAHLETVGSMWWARCGVGRETVRAKATSRWLPREGGLEAAGSRQRGAGGGVGEAHLEMAGSRWQARGSVGWETARARVRVRARVRARVRREGGAAKSGTESSLCFPKGEPRMTKKVNHPNP